MKLKIKNDLFSRVVHIIESARGAVVKSVNSEMVGTYWLIGKEIVEEEQKGQQRADYGERIKVTPSIQKTRTRSKLFR